METFFTSSVNVGLGQKCLSLAQAFISLDSSGIFGRRGQCHPKRQTSLSFSLSLFLSPPPLTYCIWSCSRHLDCNCFHILSLLFFNSPQRRPVKWALTQCETPLRQQLWETRTPADKRIPDRMWERREGWKEIIQGPVTNSCCTQLLVRETNDTTQTFMNTWLIYYSKGSKPICWPTCREKKMMEGCSVTFRVVAVLWWKETTVCIFTGLTGLKVWPGVQYLPWPEPSIFINSPCISLYFSLASSLSPHLSTALLVWPSRPNNQHEGY